MSITADYHLHSNFSGDSDAPMEQMVLSAIDKGLTHICFTEHNDFEYPCAPDEPEDIFLLNTDSYLYELLRLREIYRDKINIAFGLELGLQKQCLRQNVIFAKQHEYDFIIASSHVLNGVDPYYGTFFENRSPKEANQEFFSSILDNIKSFPNFDVCGHLDYIVRYAPNKEDYDYRDYLDIFDELFLYLIESEKGIECNTGGYRSILNTPNPCLGLLKRYRELGGEIITIGSDAHKPEHIASHYSNTEAILKEAGFKYYCIYENRLPEFKKLI